MKVYTDTSVFGGCFDSEFKSWSEKYFREVDLGLKTLCISRLVTQEILKARQEIRDLYYRYEPVSEIITIDDEVVNLAEKYISEKALSQKFFSDAVHIAASTVHKVDVIVSWNFKHIVNLNRIKLFNSVNLKNGYSLIDIRSPREVLIVKE